MSLPTEVKTILVTGKVVHSDATGTPAKGTITFTQPYMLRDAAGNVVLTPASYPVTLDNAGAFSVTLPATNSPDLDPTGFTYEITVETDAWRAHFFGEIPYDVVTPYPFVRIVPTSATSGTGSVVPDATTSTKGILRLGGDLAGTAGAPTVPGLVTVAAAAASAASAAAAAQTTANAAQTTANAAQTTANAALPKAGGVLTGALAPAVVALVDAAPIVTDASLGNHFRVTLDQVGATRQLANPTNPTNGQRVMWEIVQDGTGSRLLTLGSKFVLGTDITTITLSTAAGKRDFLGAVYNATTDRWYVIAFVKGY